MSNLCATTRHSPSTAHPRVLIMDDDETIRRLLGKALLGLGYEARCACRGEETIREYRAALECGQRYNAVLIDLTVGLGMDGARTIGELVRIDPDVRAIAFSGSLDHPAMEDPGRYGFRAVAAKPFGVHQLDQIIRNVMANPELLAAFRRDRAD